MDWLNYHHLHYFWTVARERSVTRAAARLRLSPSTVSAQIKTLEDQLGAPLFERVGRGLELTDAGRTAFAYADRIFALGRELTAVVEQGGQRPPERLAVGVADVVPKLVAQRLIAPALASKPIHLTVTEGRPERLVAELTLSEVDLVITDAPVNGARTVDHLLGVSAVSVFAPPDVAESLRAGFPGSLDRAPFLLPLGTTTLRRSLDAWFDRHGIAPSIVAEFEDNALLQVFGQAGGGLFAAPSVVADAIVAQTGVQVIGHADGLEERFYAVTLGRDPRGSAVRAILAESRSLFG